jgi:hypothetical protein
MRMKESEMLVKAQARGGAYAMVSGGPAAANLNERLEGDREVAGEAGWKEVSGSPPIATTILRSPSSSSTT